MASLYRDLKSPFWYIRYKGADGKWKSKSTRYRHGIASETRKARELCAQSSLEEHRRSPRRDAWATWVPDYLHNRYRRSTQRRMLNCWQRLSEYFTERAIFAPQDLDYRTSVDYLCWRKRNAAHNTALLELKLLSIICEEAIRRGIINRNPAAKLGIARERGREKPELTDTDIAKIRAALKSEPDWMSHAFEIALHQGCRLSETALAESDLDFTRGLIRFRQTKGDKPFSVPLHPELKPILQKAFRRRKQGDLRKHQADIFGLPNDAARDFHRFFKKLGISNVTFHCTRVTVASRLARSGYPLAKAMRLLNHSSELVHRTYQRLQPEDVADAFDHFRYDSGSNESADSPPAI